MDSLRQQNRKKSYTNILIGGSGFIGAALAKKLSEEGESVLSISRHIPEKTDLTDGLALDVGKRKTVRKNFPEGENVFILIGQKRKNFSGPKELQNLKNIIEVLNKRKPKKVFYLSSAMVYGETNKPARE